MAKLTTGNRERAEDAFGFYEVAADAGLSARGTSGERSAATPQALGLPSRHARGARIEANATTDGASFTYQSRTRGNNDPSS